MVKQGEDERAGERGGGGEREREKEMNKRVGWHRRLRCRASETLASSRAAPPSRLERSRDGVFSTEVIHQSLSAGAAAGREGSVCLLDRRGEY